jgi:HK97 family phage portal protein
MNFWHNISSFFRHDTTVNYRDAAAANSAPATTASAPATTSAPRLGYEYNPLCLNYSNEFALNIATVYRCVKVISESVANLPLQYLKKKDGVFVPDVNSRLYYLLMIQPDGCINAFDFWVQVVQDILLWGNAYIIPIYNPVSMDIDRLARCNPNTVSYSIYDDTYDVNDCVNVVYGHYSEDDVIHLKGLSLDGKKGLSVLSFARVTTSIASKGDEETLNRFANGGTVRGILSNNSSVKGFGEYADKELENEAKNFDERANTNGEHVISIPGQVDFKQISMSSTDMQFLESRKFTVREICRFFGVQPSYVFDDTSNNYKSAEMANIAFLSNTLNPILRKIETELTRKLVAPSLVSKHKFEFDRHGLYSCDLDSRIKYQAQTIAAGLYTVNEWRREENKPTVKGGDKVLVSANLRDINDESKVVVNQPKENNKKDDDNEKGNENS